MKSVPPSTSWISRNYREADHHSSHHQLVQPPSPTYIAPRLAPKPPTQNTPTKSSFKSLQSVFRKPNRVRSGTSLHSAYSASTATTTTTTSDHSGHPYAAMQLAPLPVVSTHEPLEDEAECPVCLEPLSFSFRLPGEKPHIVPECGHALHEVSQPLKQHSHHSHHTPRPALQPYTDHRQAKHAPPFPVNQTSAYAEYAEDP